MTLFTRWVLALVACFVCVSTVLAQISMDVSLVTFVATVTDGDGRHVPNLGVSDFIVIEDGKEQKISLVEQSDDQPLSIGVLLDASTSMTSKMPTAITAIDRFLRALEPDDDVFLMSFAAKPVLEQNFTSDRNKISKALHNVKLSNQTALYDAIEQGIAKVRDGKQQKKALLLVTDGEDTISRVSLDQAMDDVRQSHVLLYCLGIGSATSTRRTGPGGTQSPYPVPGSGGGRGGTYPSGPTITLPGGIHIPLPGTTRRQFPSTGGPTGRGIPASGGMDSVDMTVLNALAAASGAKAWRVGINPGNSNSIDDALDEMSVELRSQYTIGYYPDHPVNDGKWHQVVVRAKDSAYDVRSRKEYFGGRPDK